MAKTEIMHKYSSPPPKKKPTKGEGLKKGKNLIEVFPLSISICAADMALWRDASLHIPITPQALTQ